MALDKKPGHTFMGSEDFVRLESRIAYNDVVGENPRKTESGGNEGCRLG